jgi:hypothetical protein
MIRTAGEVFLAGPFLFVRLTKRAWGHFSTLKNRTSHYRGASPRSSLRPCMIV